MYSIYIAENLFVSASHWGLQHAPQHQSFVTTASPQRGRAFSALLKAPPPREQGTSGGHNFTFCSALNNRKSPSGKDHNVKTLSFPLHCGDNKKSNCPPPPLLHCGDNKKCNCPPPPPTHTHTLAQLPHPFFPVGVW